MNADHPGLNNFLTPLQQVLFMKVLYVCYK